jgi:hypothetical protein
MLPFLQMIELAREFAALATIKAKLNTPEGVDEYEDALRAVVSKAAVIFGSEKAVSLVEWVSQYSDMDEVNEAFAACVRAFEAIQAKQGA